MNDTEKEKAEEAIVTEISSEKGNLIPMKWNGPLVRAAKPSGLIWRNTWGKKILDSYRAVVEAANNLSRACMDHEHVKARLQDLEDEIKTERINRKMQLEQAKRKQEKAELEHRRDMANLMKDVTEAEQRAQPQAEGERRKPDPDHSKSRMERKADELFRCMKDWEDLQKAMKEKEIPEDSNEWKAMYRQYQNRVETLQDS